MYQTAKQSASPMRRNQMSGGVRRALFLSVLFMLSMIPCRLIAQSASDEYQIKAAFLFHFAQLVEWPTGAPTDAAPSIKLCVFNDDSRREQIQSVIEGKAIGARILRVHAISQPLQVQACDILFLSRDQIQRQAGILRSIRGMGILTVGETPSFLSDGGMIRFHIDNDKIRFDINLEAAESSHLQISSRLLLLATSVTGKSATDRER